MPRHNSIPLSDEEQDSEAHVNVGSRRSNTANTNRQSSTGQGRTAALTSESAMILEAMQAENFTLRSQLNELKLKVNTVAVDNRKKSKKDEGVPDSISQFDNEVSKNGRKYSLTMCPWIENNVFDNLKFRPDVDPLSEERFKDDASMLAGTVAELYDFLPEKLHPLMKNHSRFGNLFRNSVQGARSNAILAVRQKAGYIFSLKQEYFDTTFDRSAIPELQAMLKFPKDKTYKALAPVLFADFKQDPAMKNLFKNEIVVRIGRTILFGKSLSTKSKPQTVATIWKVTEATPGLIAFCGLLARFLASPDSELRPIGPTTKINWLADFNEYKKALSQNSKKVREIFAFFNKHVFNSTKTTETSETIALDDKEELEDAWNALAEDSESNEEDAEMDVESTSSRRINSGSATPSSSSAGSMISLSTSDKQIQRPSATRAPVGVKGLKVMTGNALSTKNPASRRAASPSGSDDSFGLTELEKCELREQEAVARLRNISLENYMNVDKLQDTPEVSRNIIQKVKKAYHKKTARPDLDFEDFSEAINFDVREVSEAESEGFTEAHVVKTNFPGVTKKNVLPKADACGAIFTEDIQQDLDSAYVVTSGKNSVKSAFQSPAGTENDAVSHNTVKARNISVNMSPTPANSEAEDSSVDAARKSNFRKTSTKKPVPVATLNHADSEEETESDIGVIQSDAIIVNASAPKSKVDLKVVSSRSNKKPVPAAAADTDGDMDSHDVESTGSAPSSKRFSSKKKPPSVSSESAVGTYVDEPDFGAASLTVISESQEQVGGAKAKKRKAAVATQVGTRRSVRKTKDLLIESADNA